MVVVFQTVLCQAAHDSVLYYQQKAPALMETAPDSAIKLLNKGLQLSREYGDSEALAWFSLQKARLFIRFNDTTKAIKYLGDALNSYARISDRPGMAQSFLMLGAIKNSKPLIDSALFLFKEQGDRRGLASGYLEVAAYMSEIPDYGAALAWVDSTLNLAQQLEDSVLIGKGLMARSVFLLKAGNRQGAIKGIRTALESPHLTAVQRRRLEILDLRLGMVKTGSDQAIERLKGLLNSDGIGIEEQIEITGMLAAANEAERNYREALNYMERADSLRLLAGKANKENLVKLLEGEYNGRLKSERIENLNARLRKEFYLKAILVITLLSAVVFVVIIYRQQRSRLLKKRALLENRNRQAEADKRLVESELANRRLEEEVLTKEIENRKTDLWKFAENFVHHSDVLKKLQLQIDRLKRSTSDTRRRATIGELSMALLQLSQREMPRKHLLEKTLHIDDEVLFQLQQKFPKLTEQDMELLVFIISNMDSSEIAGIYNIEKSSVMTKRYRLRKKLGMKREETFEDFIENEISLNVEI